MTKVTDLRLERRLRRIFKPDGRCYQCENFLDPLYSIGPLVITITMPNDLEPGERETFTHEFCSWECLGHWAAVQAGWENYRSPLDA
jgi:hypothetical protein